MSGYPEMTPRYQVTALRMGRLHVDEALQSQMGSNGKQPGTPIWCAAVEGERHRLVIDTGVATIDWAEKYHSSCVQEADETIVAALAQIGWDPPSVQIIINTHLHYDHCGGNSLFPHARFFVSAREWDYAMSPIATQASIYDKAWLQGDLNYFSYQLTQDHFEVLPGIRLIMTPGHTPGHQSVLVNTDEGVLAVAGDAVRIVENVRPGLPPQILYNTVDALASIERIKRHADRLLAGHDPDIRKYQDRSFRMIR
jgi:N-acyl homoserine lactone hydrolase